MALTVKREMIEFTGILSQYREEDIRIHRLSKEEKRNNEQQKEQSH